MTLQTLGALDEAVTRYRQVLALAPGHVGALRNLGNSLAALGRHDGGRRGVPAGARRDAGRRRAARQPGGLAGRARAGRRGDPGLDRRDGRRAPRSGRLAQPRGRLPPGRPHRRGDRGVPAVADAAAEPRRGVAQPRTGVRRGRAARGGDRLLPARPRRGGGAPRASASASSATSAACSMRTDSRSRRSRATARPSRSAPRTPRRGAAWASRWRRSARWRRRPRRSAGPSRSARPARTPTRSRSSCSTCSRRPRPEQAFAVRRAWNEAHARPLASLIRPHTNVPTRSAACGSATSRPTSAGTRRRPRSWRSSKRTIRPPSRSSATPRTAQDDDYTARFRALRRPLARRWPTSRTRRWPSRSGPTRSTCWWTSRRTPAATACSIFARKPAPVQVTAWGYATGTGLDAMDAFFADPVVVPAGRAPLVRRGGRQPPERALLRAADRRRRRSRRCPALARGTITFGSYNRPIKITPTVLETWARILLAVPDSRLLLKPGRQDSDDTRERLLGPAGAPRGRSGPRRDAAAERTPRAPGQLRPDRHPARPVPAHRRRHDPGGAADGRPLRDAARRAGPGPALGVVPDGARAGRPGRPDRWTSTSRSPCGWRQTSIGWPTSGRPCGSACSPRRSANAAPVHAGRGGRVPDALAALVRRSPHPSPLPARRGGAERSPSHAKGAGELGVGVAG